MPSTTIKGDRVPIRLWAQPHEVESDAIRQLKAVASLPWVAHHVAVMPDVHVGTGATVGSVIAMQGAVAPAAVGVDIGCGMLAARSSLRAEQLPDNLRPLRLALEARVPVDRLRYAAQMEILRHSLEARRAELFTRFGELTAPVQLLLGAAELQLGTLGGGNHFIELCLDTEDAVWILLHS